MGGQTKLESFLESCLNILIGYLVALASQLVVFPMVGIHVPFQTNLIIGFWFTLISLVRSYAIRRWFNMRTKPVVSRTAQVPEAPASMAFSAPDMTWLTTYLDWLEKTVGHDARVIIMHANGGSLRGKVLVCTEWYDSMRHRDGTYLMRSVLEFSYPELALKHPKRLVLDLQQGLIRVVGNVDNLRKAGGM